MVTAYNSRTVKQMAPEDRDAILAAGVPLGVYTSNYADLGPNNSSAIKRFAAICELISKNELPLPPSAFIEFIAGRTTGKSKQDFSMTVDAKKGEGKSWGSAYVGGRYAIETADIKHGDPTDYFSLANCALLEDTEGITEIINSAEKYQALIIDDAGTAIGSRDFAQQKNKNFNKILTVCRTKRWFVILNSPMASHLDLQVRELVDASAHVYKPFHDLGFNFWKIHSTNSQFRFGKKKIFERRFSFYDRKYDFYCMFSPDVLEPFKGFTAKYDKQREEATNRLIKQITDEERDRNHHVSPREKKRQDLLTKWGERVLQMDNDGKSARQITRTTGLTDHMVNVILSEMRSK